MPKDLTGIVDALFGEVALAVRRVDDHQTNRLLALFEQAPVIFTAAAGRSGLVLSCAAMRLMHMGWQVHVAGEITAPAIREGNLLLLISGSGETESIVVKAKRAHDLGARIGLITANPGSTLDRLAEVSVHIHAPTPKAAAGTAVVASFQPMGNLFEQAAFMLLEAGIIKLMNKTGITANEMFVRHANLE